MTEKATINQDVYLREAAGNAARVWVLTGAKPAKLYVYVDRRWVEVSLAYNGEEAAPRRRAEDAEKELEHLEPKE